MSEKDSDQKLIKIKATIERIRPFMQREGGDVTFDNFDEKTGVVTVRIVGACSSCFLAGDEISQGVETILKEEIPSVTRVEIISPSGTQSSFDPAAGNYTINGIPVYDPLADDDLGEEEEDPLSARAQLVRAQRILQKTGEIDEQEKKKEGKSKK